MVKFFIINRWRNEILGNIVKDFNTFIFWKNIKKKKNLCFFKVLFKKMIEIMELLDVLKGRGFYERWNNYDSMF